jgi:hypothetical protein
MFKLIALLGVLAVCLSQYCQSSAFSSSAAQGIVTGIFSFNLGSFSVGGPGSSASLINGQDITCYNYSLNTPLTGTPSVVTSNLSFIQQLTASVSILQVSFTFLSALFWSPPLSLFHSKLEHNGDMLTGIQLPSTSWPKRDKTSMLEQESLMLV